MSTMNMENNDIEDTKNKKCIIKLLNIIKKNNVDSNIQIKLDNIEKRVNNKKI